MMYAGNCRVSGVKLGITCENKEKVQSILNKHYKDCSQILKKRR